MPKWYPLVLRSVYIWVTEIAIKHCIYCKTRSVRIPLDYICKVPSPPSLGFSRYAKQSGGKDILTSWSILEGFVIVHQPIFSASSSDERRPLFISFRKSPTMDILPVKSFLLNEHEAMVGPCRRELRKSGSSKRSLFGEGSILFYVGNMPSPQHFLIKERQCRTWQVVWSNGKNMLFIPQDLTLLKKYDTNENQCGAGFAYR